ncbi:ADP-ribosylglycohydrolase family protein [Marinilactibacillus sp. XAAS-LB27]|uniref:ADP-ribosylglycohydrolase family protein n=1 Tax=Marinilactibacillus sp. XAAS-LB27 TaxID=3114538 RepID=UPI002E16BCB1|nr:ADP-ribosylglycohydrolase family protein [Marinilactibacillus sp. XAAS-LB27]
MEKRILGSLAYAAMGDAMAAVTENLTFEQIRKRYDGGVTTFEKPSDTAFALGNEPGQVTDDFSQIYLILKEVLASDKKSISTDNIKQAIIKWSDMPVYFNRFAGPTTRSAIAMYKGESKEMKPLEGAVTVDYASKATNGAAMKIAPAGLLNPGDKDKAIRDAIVITRVTHDNHLAISGASAVAAAVSESLKENVDFSAILDAGVYGALEGERLGKELSRTVAGPSVVERIKLAFDIADGKGTKEEKLLKFYQLIGTGLHVAEAVPCAFGIIKLNMNNPKQAVLDAVNIGYDTDTIATIVGSIVGSMAEKNSDFYDMIKFIEEANQFEITRLAKEISIQKD